MGNASAPLRRKHKGGLEKYRTLSLAYTDHDLNMGFVLGETRFNPTGTVITIVTTVHNTDQHPFFSMRTANTLYRHFPIGYLWF
jgi:hypothetical protein